MMYYLYFNYINISAIFDVLITICKLTYVNIYP